MGTMGAIHSHYTFVLAMLIFHLGSNPYSDNLVVFSICCIYEITHAIEFELSCH